MAQSLKYKGQSSILRNHIKKLDVVIYAYDPWEGEEQRPEGPWDSLTASLTESGLKCGEMAQQ